MTKSATVDFSETTIEFAQRQIVEGRYSSLSDLVEASIRLLQDQDEKVAALRAAIIAGEESGDPKEFDFDEFLAGQRASWER